MTRAALRLDHAGLALKDLERGRAAYAKLGFTLSSRSVHAGALSPGGPVVPWGSGNHCAMFEQGYFELIGLIDEQLPSSVKRLVAQYEGLHIVAMDTESADAAYAALTQAGVVAAAPAALERDAAFGPHDESVRRARFRNIYLDGEAYPEARFIVIEHGTRDVLWQDHLLTHANGVTGLAALYFCAPDPAASAARFTRLLGAPVHDAERGYRYDLQRGTFWLMSEAQLRQAVPVLAGQPAQRVAAACFTVRSLDHLRAYLDGQGVPHTPGVDADGRPAVWVGPEFACHAALQFVQAPAN